MTTAVPQASTSAKVGSSSSATIGRFSTVMPRSRATCMRDIFVTLGRMDGESLVTYLPSLVMARKLLVPNSSMYLCSRGSRKSGIGNPAFFASLAGMRLAP